MPRDGVTNCAALQQCLPSTPPFVACSRACAQCTEADVPILKLLRKPCPAGRHGYDCSERWDLLDSFLPDPR